MRRFQFELADASCDADLRQLLAGTPMAGAISLAFAREPSYFGAAEVDGDFVQIGVVRDRNSGRIIGMGSRAISERFVNGTPQPIGYLSGLRLAPEFRGTASLLARGYAFLRELHQDRAAVYYLTTIADDNQPALSLLASGRAGLPIYHPLEKYVTVVMRKAKKVRESRDSSIHVRWATKADRKEVLGFLLRHGPSRQFFPAYHEAEIFADSGRLKLLNSQDTLLAFRHDRLIGTLGFWNQASFKQTIVYGYQRRMRMARPLYNGWARLRGQPRLPSPGDVFRATYGAIPVVSDGDKEVFRKLIASPPPCCNRDHQGPLLLGLCETDPLLSVARQYAAREYVTRLFLVYWKVDAPDIEALINRVPYLELGCL